ncbi:tRNA (adenosine(37)-N6)-threonylcarbamoyltransferase complex ATPase subunit type 1 TsaE [Synechococcus sp. ROS8604]|uniref:tRNA (adenosine(37)-N6)-threonylcarbamoyltransferase complex ATPase subunit type 1 TsaE n=1 Tax=Synechococcus sp. ROS8604 TaxID=1442557 RepID=UPI001647B123|nr:tRNA (adenosine(37)-N6)-threonylcarbamoyltransferase complex ATPase subunit type 1 TsaE [Synechococcus sp. ROS8604]QNI86833.1 tRNA threonylcarbamoyladenosine biosynthesis protein TsaE [Synechococcus sp. ROS8604]
MNDKYFGDAEASGSLVSQSTDETRFLDDLEATKALGRMVAARLKAHDILLLRGPLGAGKTSLVQGLANALGIQEPITSPTFALAQHYPEGTPPLIHLDLYRLEQAAAADDLFLQEEEEATAMEAVLVVEWPERLSLSLPDAWLLELNYAPERGRIFSLYPPTSGPRT